MVQAGTWKNDVTGWWYDYGNGTYPASSWQWIDGNNDGIAECYYFNQYGYMAANTIQDGCQLNADGQWVSNGVVQTKNIGVSSNTANQQVSHTQNYTTSESSNNGGLNLIETEPVQRTGMYKAENVETTRKELWKVCLKSEYRDYRAYLLDGNYTELTFKYAPMEGLNEKSGFTIAVYGDDDTLLWESDEITYKNHTQSAVVDISGQDEIRLYIDRTKMSYLGDKILIKDIYVR